MISVSNLTFDYPGHRALDRVSFTVATGSITALVGPNGAGKTTLLRCLAALDTPLSGAIHVAGVDAFADPRATHRKIGYLSDFFGLYSELTVRQCLLYAAASRGLAEVDQTTAALVAAERLGLTDRLELKAEALSRGLRQRLAIAQAIVHQPQLLLLDEPASGLDPEARHALAELFLALRDDGLTIVVSSHILAELDAYSTDMLVIRGGRILAHDPIRPTAPVSVTLRLTLAAPAEQLTEILTGWAGVQSAQVDGLCATLSFSGDADARHRLLKGLIEQQIPISEFAEEHRNMQHAYLDSLRTSDKGVSP